MLKLFTEVWNDVKTGRNLDIYIVIPLSIAIAVLGIFGVANQNIIASVILTVLAVISGSLLQNRRNSDAIRDTLSNLDRDTNQSIESFLTIGPPLWLGAQETLANAHEAFIWGPTLERTIPLLRDKIAAGLQLDLRIRFLMVKPNSSAAKMAGFRTRNLTSETVNLVLQKNLLELSILATEINPPAALEVRVIDYLAPWHIVGIDTHTASGQLFVRISAFRNSNTPNFQLETHPDNRWANFFKQQFEAVWLEAETVNLNEYVEQGKGRPTGHV